MTVKEYIEKMRAFLGHESLTPSSETHIGEQLDTLESDPGADLMSVLEEVNARLVRDMSELETEKEVYTDAMVRYGDLAVMSYITEALPLNQPSLAKINRRGGE